MYNISVHTHFISQIKNKSIEQRHKKTIGINMVPVVADGE